MVYLPIFPLECGHFSPNVGKYIIHGSYGSMNRFCQIRKSDHVKLNVTPQTHS